MRLVNPSTEFVYNENPQKHIEAIARTCYKSEDKITEDSNKKIIANLYKSGHHAMLEHFVFVYQYNGFDDVGKFIKSNPYFRFSFFTVNNKPRYIISFNARTLIDTLYSNGIIDAYEEYKNKKNDDNEYHVFHSDYLDLVKKVIYDYNCPELFGGTIEGEDNHTFTCIKDFTILTPQEQWIHGWKSVKFVCDRGVSHEIVRHRDASFAQESTRYCNYSKDKFGKEISVIKPFFFDEHEEKDIQMSESPLYNKYAIWENCMNNIEKAYVALIEAGATPQEARSILPNSLKTELVMTAHYYEWGHFFSLRADKHAHPQMKELAIPLLDKFVEESPVLFQGIYNEIKEQNNEGD